MLDRLLNGRMLILDGSQFFALDQRVAADGDKNKPGAHGLPSLIEN
jgi:hypothetical protein